MTDDYTIERNPINGSLLISTMQDDQYIWKSYYGYDLEEAIEAFTEHLADLSAFIVREKLK